MHFRHPNPPLAFDFLLQTTCFSLLKENSKVLQCGTYFHLENWNAQTQQESNNKTIGNMQKGESLPNIPVKEQRKKKRIYKYSTFCVNFFTSINNQINVHFKYFISIVLCLCSRFEICIICPFPIRSQSHAKYIFIYWTTFDCLLCLFFLSLSIAIVFQYDWNYYINHFFFLLFYLDECFERASEDDFKKKTTENQRWYIHIVWRVCASI